MKTNLFINNKVSKFMLLMLSVLTIAGPANAAGLLTPRNSSLPELELRDHKVRVVIEDGYAITTVDQVFYNPHSEELEAVYSFPVPAKGAVSEFTMWIDGKPIHGEVLKKKQAREVYQDQMAKGNDVGLTEKNDYKTFEMRVFPVLSGQETKVRLSYIQPAHVDTNMGRYIYPLEEGGVDDQAMAFWQTNNKVTGTFSFDLVVRSGYPVTGVRLPSHPQAQITQNENEWHVHIDNHLGGNSAGTPQALTINNQNDTEQELETVQPAADPSFRLDRDIVVYYRHAENLPGAVDMVAYKEPGSQRGTFMMTVTPGMDLKTINGGRDWVFVLDISGSMAGKYATLAEGVSRALRTLNPNDRFRIVLFNTRPSEMTNGFTSATDQNVRKYIDKVSRVKPGQGTNLYDGLKLGLHRLDSDRTTSILLVTDGVANVGETEQRKFIDMIKKYDMRLFTFVMGNSANRPMLEAMTRASNGFAISVSNSDDIVGKIMEAQSKVNFESLHGAKIHISGVKTTDIEPQSIGSVYRGEQLIVFGHYFGSGEAEVKLSGKISGEDKVYQTRFNFPDTAVHHPEIERLWAYAVIERLTQEMEDFGEKADMKEAVADLGIEYGLVTDYTSMIVVDDEVFQELGIERRNQKRLEKEFKAREVRKQNAPVSRRVDRNQPMFTGSRPTFSGGAGAFDPVSALALSPLLIGLGRGRRKQKHQTDEA